MNLVFIHPAEKIKQDTLGNIYTDGSYSMRIWERYLQIADHITLVMRRDLKVYDSLEAEEKFNIIDGEKIDFVVIPDRSKSVRTRLNFKTKKEIRRIVFEQIDKNDGVIVRLPGLGYVIDYAKRAGKPCLVEVVGCPFDSLWNHSFVGKILAIPAWCKMKRALVKANNSIYVTNGFLQGRYHTKGDSIGCSDVSVVHPSAAKIEEVIKRRSVGKIVLGTAAGIDVRYKGQQYVIRAMRKLKEQGFDNFEYQIAGNGDPTYLETEARKNGVTDMVRIIGSIPHDRMTSWYRGLDIYIQPSRQEGLPRSVIEAMTNGTCCIGSMVGGIPELLDEELLFEKGNVSQLTSLLKRYSDAELREEKAKKLYLKSAQYDEDTLNNRRIEFMRKVFVFEENE